MIDLERYNALPEAPMMPSHLSLLREERFNQMHNTLDYLKKHHNTESVLNASDPTVCTSESERRCWIPIELVHALSERTELLSSV